MIKLMKYLKKSAGYIVLIIALLFLQAYCDLSLPDYTSKIINVGIQQKGIEDSVPDKLRDSTLQNLQIFMDEDQKKEVSQNYTQEEDTWVLNDDISKETRENLNEDFSKAMMMVAAFSEDSEQGQAMVAQMGLPEGTDPLTALAQMPEEAVQQIMSQVDEKLKDMPESIVTQAGVSFVASEYEALGTDVGAIQMRYILMSGIRMLAMALVIMLAAISVTFISARVAGRLGHDLRNSIYRKVMSFSSREYHKFSTASLITRSTNDVQQVQQVMAMMFRIVLYAPILGIGGVIKVLNTDSSMTWILGVAVGLILIVIFVLFQVAMPKFTILQTLIDRLNLVSREILTGIPVIRAFSREKHEEDRFEKANLDLTKTNLFVNRCMTFMMPIMMLIMNGVSVLIIYSGAHAVDNGTMQVGNVMAFIQYAMQIIMAFLFISMVSIMMPRAQVAAERVNEILDMEVMIKDPEEPKEFLPEKKGEVEFKNVYFCYPDADEAVLHNISFTAPAGKTTAFIGSTGSGKSTLINLIPRFFDVSRGSILVDGVDIRDVKQHDLCEKIGYVPQKGVLFSGTIESNLKYGKEDATIDEVKRAARIAQATDFIEEKEEKYDSPIAQGGSNVSGGQKQRLSIARAIAKDPEIYIFDDSFSALDYKTDVKLRSELQKETNGSTTLIVAQRISTILHADQIIVLDEGNIVGKGTHEELLNTCPVYQQIAKSQLSEDDLKKAREVSDHE